jgi:hypothetical protein
VTEQFTQHIRRKAVQTTDDYAETSSGDLSKINFRIADVAFPVLLNCQSLAWLLTTEAHHG